MPEQPPWSNEKPSGLDLAFLEELASLGRIELEFEGTTYMLEEGSTGQELVWMEGSLEVELSGDLDQLEIVMDGGFATPWPERQPISGTLLENPNGIEVEVPWIDFSTMLNVSADNCSTMDVVSDGWNYSVLSCELLLPKQQEGGDDLFLLTLYLGRGEAGEVDVVGGVTTYKDWMPAWMATWMDNERGSLVERYLSYFYAPSMIYIFDEFSHSPYSYFSHNIYD